MSQHNNESVNQKFEKRLDAVKVTISEFDTTANIDAQYDRIFKVINSIRQVDLQLKAVGYLLEMADFENYSKKMIEQRVNAACRCIALIDDSSIRLDFIKNVLRLNYKQYLVGLPFWNNSQNPPSLTDTQRL